MAEAPTFSVAILQFFLNSIFLVFVLPLKVYDFGYVSQPPASGSGNTFVPFYCHTIVSFRGTVLRSASEQAHASLRGTVLRSAPEQALLLFFDSSSF